MKLKIYHFEFNPSQGSYLLIAANNIVEAKELADKCTNCTPIAFKRDIGGIYDTANPQHEKGLILVDRFVEF